MRSRFEPGTGPRLPGSGDDGAGRDSIGRHLDSRSDAGPPDGRALDEGAFDERAFDEGALDDADRFPAGRSALSPPAHRAVPPTSRPNRAGNPGTGRLGPDPSPRGTPLSSSAPPSGRRDGDPRPANPPVRAVPDGARSDADPREVPGRSFVVPVPARPRPALDVGPPMSSGSADGRVASTNGSAASDASGRSVSIHIGRLDVRANLEVAPSPPPDAEGSGREAPSGLSLEDYLAGKRAGR
jgi:hypothetical protein